VRVAIGSQAKPKPETGERKYRLLPGVSETATLTLRARAHEHERSDRLFADPVAAEWFRQFEWPPKQDRWWSSINTGRGLAFRADAIDDIVAQYHSSVPSFARSALRQALSYLRRTLGPSAITTRGEDEVGLGSIDCDAVRFDEAIAAGHPDEAMALYAGNFLDGLFVSDASPDLEEWLETERVRLRHSASAAAFAIATA